jgi:hypothetical protein
MDRKVVRLGATFALAMGALAMGAWPSTIAAAACPAPLPQGSDPVTLDPADFGGEIDNPYLPMAPGATWIYRESDPQGNAMKVKVTVTTRTKRILGIDATVVHDVVSDHGEVVENTFDWYAQDACGNVWYLGENTKEYENGEVVSTAGSWQAGVDGGQPGVIMPADPEVGLVYREEYYAGEAEDAAEVLSIDEQAQVRYGHFRNVVLTKNYTPLEPRVLEYKLYAEGVGLVLAFGVSGGNDREALLRFDPPSG